MTKSKEGHQHLSEIKGQCELMDHHLRFAEAQQTYISGYIQLADTKCAWSFAVAATLAGYTLTNSSSPLLQANGNFFLRSICLVAVGLLITSAVYAFRGIAPRLKSTLSTNLFFFGTVAAYNYSSDFITASQKCSAADLTEIRLRHNYDIAKICRKKYGLLKRGLWLGFAGVCVLGLALGYTVLNQISHVGVKDTGGTPPVVKLPKTSAQAL
ncbi:Pycsar system effector family protein [Xanthomonas melonis]|uniref:Pycsar system effector family protein n=1 Tax=Xanthomonas melonis TaxID=56456 RepID=UPI003EB9DE33